MLRRARLWLMFAAVASALFLLFAPRISQDPAYHQFADTRTLAGIPNFWNVISNLPFLPVGLVGLRLAKDAASRVVSAGLALTAFGSAYYHYSPSDASLFWDRLPMTLVFMAVTARVIDMWTESQDRWLWPLVSFGIASVIWWRATGDLRPYALAQFGPALVLLPAAWDLPAVRGLGRAAGFYVLAKVAEATDLQLLSALPLSGHALKHFLAAAAAYFLCQWMLRHKPVPS